MRCRGGETPFFKYLKAPSLGAPRWLDDALEIPIEVIKNLFCAMDQDIDDRVSLQELRNYIETTGVPIETSIAEEMFVDASSQRPIIHESQKYAGLTIEEIQYAVRGRYAWDANAR